MLQQFPRLELEAAVPEQEAERHARGFRYWTQFVAMLFCHLGHARMLRETAGGLAAGEGKLRHLGIDAPPKRSTPACANEHRAWQLFQAVFDRFYPRCRAEAARHGRGKFRFKHRLLSRCPSLLPSIGRPGSADRTHSTGPYSSVTTEGS